MQEELLIHLYILNFNLHKIKFVLEFIAIALIVMLYTIIAIKDK